MMIRVAVHSPDDHQKASPNLLPQSRFGLVLRMPVLLRIHLDSKFNCSLQPAPCTPDPF